MQCPRHMVMVAISLLASAGTAAAALPPPAASSSPSANLSMPAKAVVARPRSSPETDRILTAMNSASTWGHPDLFGEFAGLRLYSQGHYEAAIKYFEYGARYADKPSQLYMGLMYANGRGVKKNPVMACAWLALAAQRKYPKFVATRNRICEALTPLQHDQAVAALDKLLPVYGDKVAKHRMAVALRLAQMETTGSRLGFDSGISVVSANPSCGGPTPVVGGSRLPQAGCGSTDFWSPWRWDPKKYFAARDAQWGGTVTVGALKQTLGKAKPDKSRKPPKVRVSDPAAASSSDAGN